MKQKICVLFFALMFTVSAFSQTAQRSEVSLSYGVATVPNWIDGYTGWLTQLFTNSDQNIEGWGAITVGYNFRLLKNMSLGAQVIYSSNKQTLKDSDVSTKYTNTYWSVMPNVKWNWLNLKIVSLYSRLGAGVCFSGINGDNSDSKTQFAFQVSPIGVEVGGRLAAYAEAGIGMSGSLLVGARYRF